MKTTKRNRVRNASHTGKHCMVLIFDTTKGKHRQEGNRYVLNYIEKRDCISVVDARGVCSEYIRNVPSYDKCREIINTDGYLSIFKQRDGKYRF
jgi:hypothetical protein